MLLKNRQPWAQLVRLGVPEFVVMRKPLLWNGKTIEVGLPFTGETHHARLRQLYDSHKITPATADVKVEAVKTPTVSTKTREKKNGTSKK